MRLIFSILTGKTISKITRFLKIGGGSAAPGLYALNLDPDLVKKLGSRIPKNIIITGTNGKTTTSRMIAHFAKTEGLKVIRNHTGSNLERGIASALIEGVRMFHLEGGIASHLSFDLGIWELDEAAFNSVAPKINPDIVIFLNIFRDQLDRYGEVDTILKKWARTLEKLPKKTVILVNGDDANTSSLSKYFKGKVYKFGVKDYQIRGEGVHKKQESLDFEAKNVKLNGLRGSIFQLTINNKPLAINLPLPGIYHIYDAVAAIASFSLLTNRLTDKPTHRYTETLKSFSPAFGRVEKFSLQPRGLHHKDNGYIFLIKNPAGATQVFQTIAPQIKKEDRLLLALNDKLADGTDVSWIWDGEFELLSTVNCKLITVSGTRAYDLALRLKYAGFNPKNITVETNLEKALKKAKAGLKGKLFILPTYTAMLELQGILAKSGIKKRYWEEDN